MEHVDPQPARTGVRFAGSKRVYPFSADRVRVLEDPVLVPVTPGARVWVDDPFWDVYDSSALLVWEFGRGADAWRMVSCRVPQGVLHRSYPAGEVQIVPDVERHGRGREIIDYWRAIVATRDAERDPIVWPYSRLTSVDPDSVLATYLAGAPPKRRDVPDALVLPFSANLSQREAIRASLGSSLSVIEGPPGTGKTETILNLVAAIVAADLGSVGVVSLSNPAVENVADKLEGRNFGHLAARLGNRRKLEEFRESQPARQAALARFLQAAPFSPPPVAELAGVDRRLTRALVNERRQAELRDEIDRYVVEQRQFERHVDVRTLPDLEGLPLLRRSPRRILQFIADTQLDQTRHPPRLWERIRRYVRYGRSSDLDLSDTDVVLGLQSAFYAQRIAELRRELNDVERRLEADDLVGLVRRHQELSTQALDAAVARRHRPNALRTFDQPPRSRHRFAAFCRSHPVLLSTCHSLRGNLPQGYLLDYLVIDEASQVDLLAAGLAMASCRNLIVVGDRRQLPHIPGSVPSSTPAPHPAYDYERHSVLSSVTELYGDDVPSTLLREHYRSHPAIIGYCNAAFYDGKLIPYTETTGRTEPAMWLHSTAPGNHARRLSAGGWFNQREIDVIKQELPDHLADSLKLPDGIEVPAAIAKDDIALASPYRRHAEKAAEELGDVAGTIDTVYALQGRAKPVVVLSTVLSETHRGWRSLRFVDDPRLVNVAVSRAADHFVLVTNHERLPRSRHLRDLAGYIEYRYPDQQPAASRIVSVFDLLYREYDAVLRPLAKRLSRGKGSSPAERILDMVLQDVLSSRGYEHLNVKQQVLLRNLVPDPLSLDEEQQAFVRRRSSVDFVVYNRVSRRAELAIEVDGFRFHEERPEQLRRDAIKDAVLRRVGVPLLRLPTTGSGEEQRIRQALAHAGPARHADE